MFSNDGFGYRKINKEDNGHLEGMIDKYRKSEDFRGGIDIEFIDSRNGYGNVKRIGNDNDYNVPTTKYGDGENPYVNVDDDNSNIEEKDESEEKDENEEILHQTHNIRAVKNLNWMETMHTSNEYKIKSFSEFLIGALGIRNFEESKTIWNDKTLIFPKYFPNPVERNAQNDDIIEKNNDEETSLKQSFLQASNLPHHPSEILEITKKGHPEAIMILVKMLSLISENPTADSIRPTMELWEKIYMELAGNSSMTNTLWGNVSESFLLSNFTDVAKFAIRSAMLRIESVNPKIKEVGLINIMGNPITSTSFADLCASFINVSQLNRPSSYNASEYSKEVNIKKINDIVNKFSKLFIDRNGNMTFREFDVNTTNAYNKRYSNVCHHNTNITTGNTSHNIVTKKILTYSSPHGRTNRPNIYQRRNVYNYGRNYDRRRFYDNRFDL